MAKATFKTPNTRPDIKLTLTDEEAANLKVLLIRTDWDGGDDIFQALEELDPGLEERATLFVDHPERLVMRRKL